MGLEYEMYEEMDQMEKSIERISNIIYKLQIAWYDQPDMNFGKFFSDLVSSEAKMKGEINKGSWALKDEDLENYLNILISDIIEKNKIVNKLIEDIPCSESNKID